MENERVVFLRSTDADTAQMVSDGSSDVVGDLSPSLGSDDVAAEPLISNLEDQMDLATDAALQKEFHTAMRGVYQSALASCGYKATRFLQMVDKHGGVLAAKLLLQGSKPSDGLVHLWEAGRLDLTMEALVLERKWDTLFSESEKNGARARLRALGYIAT